MASWTDDWSESFPLHMRLYLSSRRDAGCTIFFSLLLKNGRSLATATIKSAYNRNADGCRNNHRAFGSIVDAPFT